MPDKPLPQSPLGSRTSIREQIEKLLRFYHPRCIDPAGGFHGFFREDGTVDNPQVKHLVGSARMTINYAVAFMEFRKPEYLESVRHGIDFLRNAHRNPGTGGYTWILRDGHVEDATNHCYGLAFVLLAYARALHAGIEEARPYLYETWELLEQRFWEAPYGLYADEASADWVVSGYRGQNANMHLCEAFIAAFEASNDKMFLDRASLLADNMVNRQAELCKGQVWEHYTSDWKIDWDYNKGDRSNIFRPWGLQPGHQIEWAKLLCHLDRYAPAPWRLDRAKALFTVAVNLAWDAEHGGLIYGYGPDGEPYDRDKYSWVQAEAIATAAILESRVNDGSFQHWYIRLTDYSWCFFVDAATGCWYRIRQPDNSCFREAAPFSGLTEYHTFGAYSDVMAAMQADDLKRASQN